MSVPVKFRSGFSPSVVWIFFQLLLVRFVFSALTESNGGGTNGGSTTNQPFKVFLPHLPLMQFFLSEQNTCKYSDKQIRDFVTANDAKSPYYISSLTGSVSPPPTKNFYFAKLQGQSGKSNINVQYGLFLSRGLRRNGQARNIGIVADAS